MSSGADPQLADAEPWLRRLRRRRWRARSPGAPSVTLARSPSISSTIRVSEPSVDVHDTDRLAFAQDRGPVAHRGDLDEAVRDEDDAAVRPPLIADDVEHPLGQVGGQSRGHLVEHQDVGLDGERAGQVDDAQRGQGQVARDVREVEVADAQLRQPVAERLDRGLGQPQVRSDVEVRDERRLLVDGDDAAASRLGGGAGRGTARRGR